MTYFDPPFDRFPSAVSFHLLFFIFSIHGTVTCFNPPFSGFRSAGLFLAFLSSFSLFSLFDLPFNHCRPAAYLQPLARYVCQALFALAFLRLISILYI